MLEIIAKQAVIEKPAVITKPVVIAKRAVIAKPAASNSVSVKTETSKTKKAASLVKARLKKSRELMRKRGLVCHKDVGLPKEDLRTWIKTGKRPTISRRRQNLSNARFAPANVDPGWGKCKDRKIFCVQADGHPVTNPNCLEI